MRRLSRAHKLNIDDLAEQLTSPWWEQTVGKVEHWGVVMSVVFIILALVTAQVQLTTGAQSIQTAEANLTSVDLIAAPRGLFYDRQGQVLVTNHYRFELLVKSTNYAEPAQLETLIAAVGKVVAPPDKTALQLQLATQKVVVVAQGLTMDQKVRLQAELGPLPHEFLRSLQREYVLPQQFAHLIGYTGVADANDVQQGLEPTDTVGKYRLEKLWDVELRGQKGRTTSLGEIESHVAEVPGNNVVLTIDARWQKTLYEILGRQTDWLGGSGAGGVIVDVSSGDIWAQVSYPSYDPNDFAGGISASTYDALLNDWRKPLIDKAISTQTAPGSSFKLITAYSLLENGIIDENSRVFSTGCMQISAGFPFCEYGKYYLGDLNIVRALTRSSNIFFCTYILQLSESKGFQAFMEAAANLGIGRKTGIGLEGEAAGVLASPEYKQQTFKQSWFLGDACNAVIGQGFTVVTPLQMAMAMATIENGGMYYRPNIIDRIEDQQGNIVRNDFRHLEREVPVSDKTKELIRSGTSNAVTSFEGTAYRFLHDAPGNFTAKTGSAEAFLNVDGQLSSRVNGWIVGTFDYGGKKFAYALTITTGGGGWNVTQVMQRFAHCLFNDFSPQCSWEI